jgi:hypothetical protein
MRQSNRGMNLTNNERCMPLKRQAWFAAIICAFLLAISLPPAGVLATPSPQALASTPPMHHIAGTVVRNPHLKGVEERAGRIKVAVKKKTTDGIVHRAWRRRWDYHSWIALHRGLGVIHGTVRAAGGGGMTSAKVWLKHPNGSLIAAMSRKHVTYTDAAGNFTMMGVRAGRYRVVAQVGKKRSHRIAAVHPGNSAEVAIKM